MQIEQNIAVTDAREAFLRWNAQQYKKMQSLYADEAYKLIQLIPLFLQLNNKLLPGYVHPDTPLGVYAYKPDKNIVNDARKLHNKFRYQQEGVIKNPAVDSVILQRKIINQQLSCWIFYRSSLNETQVTELKEKVHKISQWFSGRGLKLDFICLTDEEFRNSTEFHAEPCNSLFLDYFYSEIILLAGKYPVWWLVPPTSEKKYAAFIEHIKQARFVDSDEFIDLGSISELSRTDVIQTAVEHVQTIKQSAETCLVELLIIDLKNSAWPGLDGLAIRLKKKVYQGEKDINQINTMAEIMHESLSHYSNDKHIFTPARLFSSLKSVPGVLNPEVIDAYLGDDYYQQSSAQGIEKILSFLNLFKAISNEIHQIFSNIVTRYNAETESSELDQSLVVVTRNMMVYLSENSDRVPLYNNKDNADIILDRILLKHEIFDESNDRWSLVLKAVEGDEKKIEGFSSLLGLLAWCWLNRVVNHSTQVSIDCPAQQVKQTEARFVLEVLMQQLNPQLISTIPPEAFENPVRPLQSLLFVNSMMASRRENIQMTANDDPLSFGSQSTNLITHCEQLIINSWGDVYTKKYSGNSGVLQCLCDWTHHAPLDSLSMPQSLMTFGQGGGDSTYMAQRTDQLYEGMINFFYQSRQENGRFILRLGSDYYMISAEDSLLKPVKIGSKRRLIEFLESPVTEYHAIALDRLAYTEHPLKEIYQGNKKNVLQIFFQVTNRTCHAWVLDEKGTLWSDVYEVFDRESFITHWLFLFRNIRNRLKNINYQDREPPALEIKQISINQLGGIEFYTVGADSVSGDKQYLDLQVSIFADENGDQLSLVCDGRRFDYKTLKKNVLIECVQYLSARMRGEGRRPVYVTDIDVPLRLFNVAQRDDIQISHILKFKRNFEHRINKLLAG